MEKKTIEEVSAFNRGYIAGAKNQSEQMYSEKEVLELLIQFQENYQYANNQTGLKYWFNQFKKS